MEEKDRENIELQDGQEKPKKKKSLLGRLIKVLLYIALTIVGLNVLIYVLLSIPYIQNKVSGYATEQLSSMLKTEVSIGEIRLYLFNQVTIKGLYVEDQAKDTLLYVQHLDVKINPIKLIRSELSIKDVALNNFVIKVNRADTISDFNFQFVIDAFASSDTTKTDTTSSSFKVVIDEVKINDGRLHYDVLSAPQTPNLFNPSHIALSNFDTNLNLNSIDVDKLDIGLNYLSAKEQSGLEILGLKAHVYSEKSRFRAKGLSLSLTNSIVKLEQAEYDLDSGEFVVITNNVQVSPIDIQHFLPNAKYLNNDISIHANARGKFPFVDVETLNINYGQELVLSASGSMSDAMHYGTSDVKLNIKKLKVSPAAINSLAKLGDPTFVAPDILNDLGILFLKADLKGKLNKFKLDAELWGQHGAVNLLANGGIDTTFTNFDVVSNIETSNFNLEALLGADMGLGKVSMHLNLNASQSKRHPLSADAKGKIDLLQYNKQEIKNVPISAYYDSQEMGASVEGELLGGYLLANAKMTQGKISDVHFDVKVESLNVDRLYKNEYWIKPEVSFRLNGDLNDLDIDKMTGKVTIDDFLFCDSISEFRPGPISLELTRQDETHKSISLRSSILSANINGQYAFTSLPDEISNMLHDYVSNVFVAKNEKVKVYQNDFSFDISVQNTEELGELLQLPVDVITPFKIDGRINTIDRKINVQGNLPLLKSGEMNFKDSKLNINNIDSAFYINLSSNLQLGIGDYNVSLKVNGANNSIHSFINVDSSNPKGDDINISGKVETIAQFNRDEKNVPFTFFQIYPTDITVGKLDLNLLPARIIHKENRTRINNFGIALHNKRYFGANGVISNLPEDSLNVYFDHAQIGDILAAFDINNIKASINGDVLLTNITDNLEVYTKNLAASDIIVFSDTLGTLTLDSQWSNRLGGVRVQSNLINKGNKYLEVEGTVYTTKDSLDMYLSVDRLPLGWVEPFMTGILNKLSGTVSTELMVSGSMKAPITSGFLGFNNTSLGIDYTNVTYTISDSIYIMPEKVGFDNLILLDNDGNKARVDANITHRNFKNPKYTLDMRMDKFMLLNTGNRVDSLFYGKLFATGTVKIKGDEYGTTVDMKVKNDKRSSINILIPQTAEASTYQSVVYINVPEDKLKEEAEKPIRVKAEPMDLKVAANVEVTPDIVLSVIIDPHTGDAMQVRGTGIINFSYDMKTEKMQIFGDYNVSEGNVKISLQGLKTLEFKIKDGSKLFFVGDPLKTNFEINAYRRVKADLKTLDTSFDTEEATSSRVLVDCILKITGNMDKMTLAYDVDLPEAKDDVKQRVKSIISTDEQRIKQFAYLVATNSFYSASSGGNIGDGMLTSLASSTISGGLNALFGNILGEKWEIGTNIESSDGTFSDVDMSVDVSRRFLDDKLKLHTNVGYNQSSTSDNSFIGDFDAEYQLSKIWTVKAYNKTNDKYYKQASTTQGVGIVYTKEASTLKRLFQSFKPRRRTRANVDIPENKVNARDEKQTTNTEGGK